MFVCILANNGVQVVLRISRPREAHTQDTGDGMGGECVGITGACKVLTMLSGGVESLSIETFEHAGGEAVAACQWDEIRGRHWFDRLRRLVLLW